MLGEEKRHMIKENRDDNFITEKNGLFRRLEKVFRGKIQGRGEENKERN